jgi:hypothetical protein
VADGKLAATTLAGSCSRRGRSQQRAAASEVLGLRFDIAVCDRETLVRLAGGEACSVEGC